MTQVPSANKGSILGTLGNEGKNRPNRALQAMELIEPQLPLQNWGERSQQYLSSTLVAVTMPFGRETDSRHAVIICPCLWWLWFPGPLPFLFRQHHQTEKRGKQQAGMRTHFVSRRINSLGQRRGPISFMFAWYIQKQGNKCSTTFSVVLELE